MTRFPILLLALASGSAFGAQLTPGDFAYGLPVELSVDAAAYRVPLPVSVYQTVARADLGDLRVFNSRGELVPYSLERPAPETVDAARASLMVFGRATQGRAGEFEFDLGARPPVDRVNLELPEVNTSVAADLLSRSDPKDPWRPVVHTGVYRLKSAGAELRNGPVHIAQDSDRYWLARIDPRGGGIGVGSPRLSVGWVAQNVVFLARGPGPFLVAYGSAVAAPAESSLEAIPNGVAIAEATAAAPMQLGGRARLLPSPLSWPWRRAVLWAVLIVAAGLLAWMALRLAREMR